MNRELDQAIDAARELAWRPICNLSTRTSYAARLEAHRALVDALGKVGRVAGVDDETMFLVAAMRRAAGATYSNRFGRPYAERREAIYQLRGCLDVWQRSLVLVDPGASVSEAA